MLAGCSSASTSLGNQVLAPLSVLPQTDVVLETNLQAALQGAEAQGATGLGGLSGVSGIGGSGGGGVPVVSGVPTSPSEVSTASAGTSGPTVLTAFNPTDRHCLGTVVIPAGATTSVLGESSPGAYDFWFAASGAASCAAANFLSQPTKPANWAADDPATSWPGP